MATAARKLQPQIDLSFARAATILARQPAHSPITFLLVGCGGTGSYMAQHLGRILRTLHDRGTSARAMFVDHDHVEEKNIGRQLFCDAELGLNKAEALAIRYGTGWGLPIQAYPGRFKASLARPNDTDELIIMIGCVDNADARKQIALGLTYNQDFNDTPDVWWLDCGNHEDAGQVLLGSALKPKQLRNAFPSEKICQALPAPSMQSPELLQVQRHEKKSIKLSCAELTAANLQSLNINAAIANQAADMLTRLVVTRDLKRFATEINLPAGSMRSKYATPEALGVAK